MSGGGSGISGMIQTIVALTEIRQRDEAHALAEKEFGLRVEQDKDTAIQNIQNTIKTSGNPSTFLKYVPQLAKRYGLQEDYLTDIIKSVPPNVETIRAQKTAAGAAAVPDEVVAAQSLAGTMPSGIAADRVHSRLFSGALQALTDMNPGEAGVFNKQFLDKQALGETDTDQILDGLVEHLTKEQKDQMLLIGKGMLPNADQAAQLRIAAGNLAISKAATDDEAAYRQVELSIRRMEATSTLKGAESTKALEVLKAIDAIQKMGYSSSATMTKEMRVRNNQSINQYNEILRQLNPNVWGDKGSNPVQDVPLDAQLGTHTLWDYLKSNLITPPKP